MALVVNNYTVLSGGPAEGQNCISLRYDLTEDKLWMGTDGVAYRRWTMQAPYIEDFAIATSNDVNNNGTETGWTIGAYSGFVFWQSGTSNSRPLHCVDPNTNTTLSTFGTSNTGLTHSSTNIVTSHAYTEAQHGGINYLLCLDTLTNPDGIILKTDGSGNLSYVAHNNSLGLTGNFVFAVAPMPPTLIGATVPSWIVWDGDNNHPSDIKLLSPSGTSITSTTLFTIDAVSDNTFFGGDIENLTPDDRILFIDPVRFYLIYAANGPGPTTRIGCVDLLAPGPITGPVWTQSISGSLFTAGTPWGHQNSRVVDHFPFLTIDPDGTTYRFTLLNLDTGAKVVNDTFVPPSIAVSVNVGWHWDEIRGLCYLRTGNATTPLIAIESGLPGTPPAEPPPEPELTLDDPRTAYRLARNDLTAVVNGLCLDIKTRLSGLYDKAGGDNLAVDIDLNGFEFTNLLNTTASGTIRRLP